MAGRFLTVEGGEGVGKSTFLAQLCDRLRSDWGLDVVQTFEPGGTPLANEYRKIFESQPEREPMFVETEFLTVAAARSQHVRHLVLPALKAGKWVVCDRYIDSSRVYQGVLGGIDHVDIDRVNHFATQGLMPDLTLLLDCNVELSLNRVTQRADTTQIRKSRFDAKPVAYHEQVRRAFLELAEKESSRFVVLDAAATTDTSVEAAVHRLQLQRWL